ncbi:GNAT family N-acetyltransferase [Aureispira anguillae]|uniref:GNAT family N-acetyltransferase n=1 Tax=Aureispira anguillae TaxID=2864201 RepID=A0A915YF17_9BACT|nr:GNAT family N-acetyltransferase [Aureispira anguillae]BDS11850.1 GNAT family N-acetyltransferase [Aureispira anguillae]
MEKIIETQRLILREISVADQDGLFELDSDPEVHRYIGTQPLTDPKQALEVIDLLQKQYKENNIGRWAVIEKESNRFLGWSGLKLYKEKVNGYENFYELGYRFIQKYWGKGFATETAKAWVDYGFRKLGVNAIYAMTDPENINSRHVLEKAGFRRVEQFDFDGDPTDWFEITRSNWE